MTPNSRKGEGMVITNICTKMCAVFPQIHVLKSQPPSASECDSIGESLKVIKLK